MILAPFSSQDGFCSNHFMSPLSCHFWLYRRCLMYPDICLIVHRYASFCHMLVRMDISQATNTTAIQFSASDGIWTHETFAKQISRRMYNAIADSWGHWSTPNEITESFLGLRPFFRKQTFVYMPVLYCDVKNWLLVYLVHIILGT